MSEVGKFKDNLLYEVEKAFYDERGKGARYRLTLVGVPYLKDKLRDKAENKDEIKKWLIENKFVEDIEVKEDEFSFNAKVVGCCLKNIRDYFDNESMEPLGCPIANMFMYAIQEENGLSPELLPIKPEGDYCDLTMAKIATDEVVEASQI